MTSPCRVFILHDTGNQVAALAQAIAEGAASVPGVTVSIKQPIKAEKSDLLEADAIIIGTPNWTGIKGTLKRWLDTTGDLWEEGSLAGKVGAAFTSSAGRHSGTEFTLLTVLHWFLGAGMIVVGLPWSPVMERAGSYYGATAVGTLTDEDLAQARALGRRVAQIASRLKRGEGDDG
ncbi:MAG: NAD(P)H-dependent oxidoreductase [Roseiflexus sp.]|nr:NAD(P)H-dependent oxidoreductase [Roseiflexus sp.]MDW8144982.1 NAD(P)H-dependent oxidoreductase [Roseiflexaceae bacterium]MDW8233820.1 NAD(P)H-dependent oxidoreductase [Roseiflexaceae bacterium]